ncbi:hypothetical protein Scep_017055 [Stephania cephalantha]|uniref:Uncharacterized protein n=1 Tax=Stephania cephalantha TaxID=152367 RepID=A0AAP0INY3_9MAGN
MSFVVIVVEALSVICSVRRRSMLCPSPSSALSVVVVCSVPRHHLLIPSALSLTVVYSMPLCRLLCLSSSSARVSFCSPSSDDHCDQDIVGTGDLVAYSSIPYVVVVVLNSKPVVVGDLVAYSPSISSCPLFVLQLTNTSETPPTVNELYLHLYTVNHDGVTFIDTRSVRFYMRRQELTQATSDQPVDDEAVYYNVASECPKERVYGLWSLGRKKRRYADPGASTSHMPEMVPRLEFNSVVEQLR